MTSLWTVLTRKLKLFTKVNVIDQNIVPNFKTLVTTDHEVSI